MIDRRGGAGKRASGIGDGVFINPHMLQPGQERIVAERCLQVLEQLGQPMAAISRAQSS